MKIKKMIIVSMFVFLAIGSVLTEVNASSTNSTEWVSTTYDRINVDRVDLTAIVNFTLADNYTALKLYFAIWPSTVDAGSAIATKTVDYSSYNNATSGTAGEVKVSTVITAYDSNAQDVNIFGGDRVYVRLYIYNASISSANLLVKSAFDTDYWPVGGRYTSPTTVTTTTSSTSKWEKYALYLFAGIGLFVLGFIAYTFANNHISFHGPERDTLEYSDGRKAWAKRWETEGFHKNKMGETVHHMPGQFKDIQDPGRAMTRDRATPHRYSTKADKKP